MARETIKTARYKSVYTEAWCLKCGHKFKARKFSDEPGNREHLCVNCRETNGEILDYES